ncbi:hypothetical protein B0H14DRAFT_3538441 [Mycena olivaceomarginata]|nr:hypothetical protein B0H14DRAFT_3538441 [Mycena olivaceomarginata]
MAVNTRSTHSANTGSISLPAASPQHMRCRLRCPLACSSPARRLSQRVGRGFYFRAARTEPPHPAADSTFLPASSPNTPQTATGVALVPGFRTASRRTTVLRAGATSEEHPQLLFACACTRGATVSGNNWSAASSSVHGSCTAQALPPVPAPELTCGPRATFLWHDVHATCVFSRWVRNGGREAGRWSAAYAAIGASVRAASSHLSAPTRRGDPSSGADRDICVQGRPALSLRSLIYHAAILRCTDLYSLDPQVLSLPWGQLTGLHFIATYIPPLAMHAILRESHSLLECSFSIIQIDAPLASALACLPSCVLPALRSPKPPTTRPSSAPLVLPTLTDLELRPLGAGLLPQCPWSQPAYLGLLARSRFALHRLAILHYTIAPADLAAILHGHAAEWDAGGPAHAAVRAGGADVQHVVLEALEARVAAGRGGASVTCNTVYNG